jgi:hypothetical protein
LSFDDLWRIIADHSWLQALFGLLLSWMWSADSAKDWVRGKAWMSASWFSIALAILVTFAVVFAREREWLAFAIAVLGFLFQTWRLRTIVSGELDHSRPK